MYEHAEFRYNKDIRKINGYDKQYKILFIVVGIIRAFLGVA